jgi:hypothetical protein
MHCTMVAECMMDTMRIGTIYNSCRMYNGYDEDRCDVRWLQSVQ